MTTMLSPALETEMTLIARLRAQDGDAYLELVSEHRGRMLAVASRFLQCPLDREDAVQDAFISAFQAIDSFDGSSRIGTWLHRITINACLMKRRAMASRRQTTGRDGSVGSDVPRSWDHPASCGDISAKLAADDVRRHIHAGLDRLPEVHRRVLILRDLEERSTAETGRLLGCTEAGVKTRLHRARRALREVLEPFAQDLLGHVPSDERVPLPTPRRNVHSPRRTHREPAGCGLQRGRVLGAPPVRSRKNSRDLQGAARGIVEAC